MQGLPSSVLLAVALAVSAVPAKAQINETSSESQSPAAARATLHEGSPVALKGALETARIHVPRASYVKLHFGRLDLPPGIRVEVSDDEGREVYRYGSAAPGPLTLDRARGDDGKSRFYAMSVTGDTAVVRLTGALHRFDPKRHGLIIDAWLAGPDRAAAHSAPAKSSDKGDWQLETTCGANQRFDAKCYAESHPAVYDRSIPVALLITPTGEECTAWRVGPTNRLFTAEHCVSGQGDLDGAEIWFHYRATDCGSGSDTEPVKVTGGELLATDDTLDYALFTVNDFSDISYIGHLGLDVRNGSEGEGIFIPQHGLGWPKQIAIESDMNTSGWCEIDDADHDAYGDATDIGYFCDTTTSSSGSPVVSRVTGDVIALHHLGGCFNSGAKMSLIWPQVSSFFGGVVPQSDGAVPWTDDEPEPGPGPGPGEDNLSPVADFTYACDGLDCVFDASPSSDDDGEIESFSWAFGDGGSGAGLEAGHGFATEGSYAVTLTVVDDLGASDSFTRNVEVTSPNQPPKAKMSAQCIDNFCQLSGAASSDPDGQVVSWNWKFGDGVSASGSEVSHEYAAAGSYTIMLTVTDNEGASDISSYTANISMPKQPPQAEFVVECDQLECSMDASASTDPDGVIAAYHWDLGDGQTASGVTVQHGFSGAGTYLLSLMVEDNHGMTAASTLAISVEAAPEPPPGQEPEPEPGPEPPPEPEPEPEPEPQPPPEPEPEPQPDNHAPRANLSWECKDLNCVFDGGSSWDRDGAVVGWNWNFGDGATATGERHAHSFPEAGRYEVILLVEDDDEATDAAWVYVQVEVHTPGTEAKFTVECTNRRCTLDAGSGTASKTPVARYDWAFGDGRTGKGRTVTHDYDADGEYRITLKVSDGDELNATRTRMIEVVSKSPIELQVAGSRMNGRSVTLLTWSGMETDTVYILRDGKRIAVAPNTGKYLDSTAADLRKTARYQVCDANGNYCSKALLAELGPTWSFRSDQPESSLGRFKR